MFLKAHEWKSDKTEHLASSNKGCPEYQPYIKRRNIQTI